MTSLLFRPLKSLHHVAGCLAAFLVASCGGGVSAPPIVDTGPISIVPAVAVMYSGLPTTFIISGGSGSYVVTSSNQAVLAVSTGVTGNSITLVPSPVTADTAVTLTVRNAASNEQVTASVTVRPGTVNNNVSITPSSTQDPSCSPAICSGGDAAVQTSLSQGGAPLTGRSVRFEVVSGNFGFITSAPGVAPEQVATSTVTATDETGLARARIRVAALASNQTALLRVTDVASGAFRQTSFAIAQFTGNTPAFFTLPSSITFTGPFRDVCASGAFTDVVIFGGVSPYSITGGLSGFFFSPQTVSASGSSFRVTLSSTPSCFTNIPIGITDATGRTIAFTLNSVAGTAEAPAPPVAITPSSLTLSCSFNTTAVTSSLIVSGGTPPISASSDHPRVSVSVTDRTVTVQRKAGDGVTIYPTSAIISATDGTTTARATATVPANCP